MRRAFTIQMYDNGELHAHICAECCKQWECRLDCFIEWIAEDHDHLGPDVLDLGEYTLCVQCLDNMPTSSSTQVRFTTTGSNPEVVYNIQSGMTADDVAKDLQRLVDEHVAGK